MKCPRCYALNSSADLACSGCGVSLDAVRRAAAPVPAWAYLFAGACGLIPIVALGGLIPIILGVGGAGSCMTIARSTSVPGVLRFFGCVLVTGFSWALFLLMVGAFIAAQQHR